MRTFRTLVLSSLVMGCGGISNPPDAGSDASVDTGTLGQACGSRGLGQCSEDQFCSFASGANCGRADHPGTCATRPEACTQHVDPVCGCDGQTYGNACNAASAGVSVEHQGACEGPCDAQEARGEGQCRRLPFGWRFNGETCEIVQGCECIGAACDSLYQNQDTCLDARRQCLPTCAPEPIWGVGDCDALLGYKWNGSACEAVSGCECSGRACGGISTSLENCEEAHRECGPLRDCRNDGCGNGTECQLCWTLWQCIPTGAVC